MDYKNKLNKVGRFLMNLAKEPISTFFMISQMPENMRGFKYGTIYKEPNYKLAEETTEFSGKKNLNTLKEFFDNRKVGPGIWKWQHYFDIYDINFKKFIGQNVKILEIGVYSGGSLEMWRDYFGEKCHIYGVDISESCKVFESDHVTIFIGDQEDRDFWRDLKSKVPQIDILIDDGGHGTNQQIATLEEMLPHIRPGGIYLCEDVHGIHNGFNSYCQGLIKGLNEMKFFDPNVGHKGGMRPNPLQAWIKGIHFYPYLTVLEKAERPIERLTAPRHGTEWLPIKTT